MNNEQVNFLTIDQATDLVERIAKRAENFNHTMSNNEKIAMSEALSDFGVTTSDLIDVNDLADNYAINAEIVTEDEAKKYNTNTEEALFSWEDDDTSYYCMSWCK